MSMIEEIKRDIRHDDGCALGDPRYPITIPIEGGECQCSLRDKIALLERLQGLEQHLYAIRNILNNYKYMVTSTSEVTYSIEQINKMRALIPRRISRAAEEAK